MRTTLISKSANYLEQNYSSLVDIMSGKPLQKSGKADNPTNAKLSNFQAAISNNICLVQNALRTALEVGGQRDRGLGSKSES